MSKMKAILVDTDNANSASSLHIGEAPIPTPKPGDVLVKVKAFGLNRMDLLQRRGNYPLPPDTTSILGVEFSGTIAQGAGVWKEGDEVFGLTVGGAYAEYVTARATMVFPKGKLSWEQAAAIPENYLTAFQLLFLVGDLKQDETVVVHAAASGVGIAAIQLARTLRNARVLGTAGTDAKCSYLVEKQGAHKAFNYKTSDWAAGVKEAIGPASVNVVLDPVGPNYFDQDIDVLAMDGRLVLFGLLSGPVKKDGLNMGPLLYKRIKLQASTLRSRAGPYHDELCKRFKEEALEKFMASGDCIVIHKVYNWRNIVEATMEMEGDKNTGKIICTID
ncbi:quinone oxidoreductase [Atractiella rhizophila]|nr:quinone oxidoreductase [Atractiella rhizophila]